MIHNKMIIAALLASLMLTGCSSLDKAADSTVTTEVRTSAAMSNINGDLIIDINHDGDAMILPGGGIFYSKMLSENNVTRTCEYHYVSFDQNSNTDVRLGTVENLAYETNYSRTYLNGKLYTLIVPGDLSDSESDPLYLMEFDLKGGSVKQYKVTDNGFPYASLTAMNGKVILFFHDQQDVLHDRLMEFDPSTGNMEQVTSLDLTGDLHGDSIRSVCSDDNLYVLRLRFNGSKDVKVFVDTYDYSYNKTNTKEVTKLLRSSCNRSYSEADIINQLQQSVSAFRIIDGKYLYYENFSTLRCIADIDSDQVICDLNEPFTSSIGDGKPVFYSANSIMINDGFDSNSVYSLRCGKLEQKETAITDDGLIIHSVSSAADGNMLIVLRNTKNNTFTNKVIVNKDDPNLIQSD